MAQFGSKVEAGDVDVGRHLVSFYPNGPSLGYYDADGSSTYTGNDIVYLYMNDIVSEVYIGDVRLTPYNVYAAGSKVKGMDSDIGYPLKYMDGPDCGIYFLDLYGNAFEYDQMDPVYILANASPEARTSLNDIRLTESRGLAPGTRVLDFHHDHDKLATEMIAPFSTLKPSDGNMATIRFFNREGNVDLSGNPIYDPEDDIYLDISLPDGLPTGFVVPNNLRLSE